MQFRTFKARDKRLTLGGRTALMAVVNVTPDSFYPGSRFETPEAAVERALEAVETGADLVDLGAESTRPGATPVTPEDEWLRLAPVLQRLRPRTQVLISVDTRRSGVAERALAEGADMVNDVSSLADPRMAEVVAAADAGLALMHMKGVPETMQKAPAYEDVVAEVRSFLSERAAAAESSGVSPESILVDPGIGFGKTLEHNLRLLRELDALRALSKPILVGTSRKSFIGRLLGNEPSDRLLGTAGSVAAAILNGADVLRVHDVREMREVAVVADAIARTAEVAP